ncbi:MAG: 3-hydroxyacyl-CoA dehydrogenase NAD-binding protein [Candidatus Xenolissoclinum pacificiensis L6]|uniref:3-hydroxyacyl-CoA dehydrogenase NAD-binding protein n=1 Tax=Candidatus Xenolissoclinum pacificiensis L6 TaxID=1401685 RepID=W2V027_9RICK|nr:MAG: 3-hydroxyacyl-CoA dehydrogenase NAD-binding protein [Candidatus Xenolissoclinum pacificiensis L6]
MKIAVIGAGKMGYGIANHIASRTENQVLLFDKTDIAVKSLQGDKNANELVIGLSIDDDIEKLRDMDFIIEAIVEDYSSKCKLYKKIMPYLKDDVVVTSNTSTMLRRQLVKKFSRPENFFITHFFNPPHFMQLLEVIEGDENTRNPNVKKVTTLCADVLGKTIIQCKDTPGFIANRLGIFFLTAVICEAHNNGSVSISTFDSLLTHRHIGIPKTGAFGLLDLIGVDVYTLILSELRKALPETDLLNSYYGVIPDIIDGMVHDGFIGRKNGCGFYKNRTINNGSFSECLNLYTGLYQKCSPSSSIPARNLVSLLEKSNPCCRVAKHALLMTLIYACHLVSIVSDDLNTIDEVMRLGYNWKYGPFEMIDNLLNYQVKGVEYLYNYAVSRNLSIPPILNHTKSFYIQHQKLSVFGNYESILTDRNNWSLADIHKHERALLSNESAKLIDIGDGIACFAFNSRNNVLDYSMLRLLQDSINITNKYFRGLVLGNDNLHFSVGVDLVLFFKKSVNYIEKLITYGQEVFLNMKMAKFPVVSAVSGYTVGGGCELSLHATDIVPYMETYMGLVETNIGVIPGWGGCKEMLLRYGEKDTKLVFEQIFRARVSKNARELKEMRFLRDDSLIVMNRKQSLSMAKTRVLKILSSYYPKKEKIIRSSDFKYDDSDYTEYDKIIAYRLYRLLVDSNNLSESEVYKLEKSAFIALIKDSKTIDRIKHMYYNKRKLHN